MIGQLTTTAFSYVTKEPMVREYGSSTADGGALVCDLAVQGVWNPQTEALLDICVVNTDAQSYASRSVTSVLDSIARAKKMKHRQACVKRRADFMPFIVATDGVIQREGQHSLKRLATRLAVKWSKPYSEVMHFIRMRLSISTLRATVHCIQEARQKLTGLHFEDGQLCLSSLFDVCLLAVCIRCLCFVALQYIVLPCHSIPCPKLIISLPIVVSLFFI